MIYLTATTSEPLPLSWMIGCGVVAVVAIMLIRWIASKYADGVADKARVEFDAMEGFDAGPVHGFGRMALAYDEGRNLLASWHKGVGTHILNPETTTRWFLGEVDKSSITRLQAMMLNNAITDGGGIATVHAQVNRIPYVILYEEDPAIPLFTVGFVAAQDMHPWEDIMTKALGIHKRRSKA